MKICRCPGDAICLGLLLMACDGAGGGGGHGGTISPGGDWEPVGAAPGCTTVASPGFNDAGRPVLLCMWDYELNPYWVPVLSTWNGESFDSELMTYLLTQDTPTSCDRLLPSPSSGGLGAACLTMHGIRLMEPDGTPGIWSAPARIGQEGESLVALRRYGPSWGATALIRRPDGGAYVQQWAPTEPAQGIYRWQPPVTLKSADIGAAAVAVPAGRRGWSVIYADGEQGGRLRFESTDNDVVSDIPSISASPVDRVRMVPTSYYAGPVAFVYREIGGGVKTGGCSVSSGCSDPAMNPVVTEAHVGELDLSLRRGADTPQVIFTDEDAGGALFYTSWESGAYSTPVQISAGRASGISIAHGSSAVAYCDHSVAGVPLRVFSWDSQQESSPVDGECLETQISFGFEDLVLVAKMRSATGIMARVAKCDRGWDTWTELGVVSLPADAENLNLVWIDLGINGQNPDPMLLGWQGAPAPGNAAEPLMSQLGTGAWRYTAHLADSDGAVYAVGPEERIYVGATVETDPEGRSALEVYRVEAGGSWTRFGRALTHEESWSEPLLTVGPDGSPVVAAAVAPSDAGAMGTLVKRWSGSGAPTPDATWVIAATGESFTPDGLVVPDDGRILLATTVYIPPPDVPGGVSNWDFAMFREPDDGGDWPDLGRPDFVNGYERHALALSLVGGVATLVYSEHNSPYSHQLMHTRWHPGRGWEQGQPLYNGSAEVFVHSAVGQPLILEGPDGALYMNVHHSDNMGPIEVLSDTLLRWTPN